MCKLKNAAKKLLRVTEDFSSFLHGYALRALSTSFHLYISFSVSIFSYDVDDASGSLDKQDYIGFCEATLGQVVGQAGGKFTKVSPLAT